MTKMMGLTADEGSDCRVYIKGLTKAGFLTI